MKRFLTLFTVTLLAGCHNDRHLGLSEKLNCQLAIGGLIILLGLIMIRILIFYLRNRK
jgi:hypothetical protein